MKWQKTSLLSVLLDSFCALGITEANAEETRIVKRSILDNMSVIVSYVLLGMEIAYCKLQTACI
jgi:hypothetical protein